MKYILSLLILLVFATFSQGGGPNGGGLSIIGEGPQISCDSSLDHVSTNLQSIAVDSEVYFNAFSLEHMGSNDVFMYAASGELGNYLDRGNSLEYSNSLYNAGQINYSLISSTLIRGKSLAYSRLPS